MANEHEVPIPVYVVLVVGVVLALLLGRWRPDVSYDILIELLGAAFIIIAVGIVMTHVSKKQWRVVKEQTSYLIARTVNRVRQSVAIHALGFSPVIKKNSSLESGAAQISFLRAQFLEEKSKLSQEELAKELEESLFSEEKALLIGARADDVWQIINMKYAEYITPEVVAYLQELYVNLLDLQSHIRLFLRKGDKTQKSYYVKAGRYGAAFNVGEVIRLSTELKVLGFSEPARSQAQEKE